MAKTEIAAGSGLKIDERYSRRNPRSRSCLQREQRRRATQMRESESCPGYVRPLALPANKPRSARNRRNGRQSVDFRPA